MAETRDTPNVKAFKETTARFYKDFKLVKDTYNISELGELELQLINELQLLEVQVSMMGRDVYDAIQERRIGITTGTLKREKSKEK